VDNLKKQLAELAVMAEKRGKPMPRIVVRWQIHPLQDGESRPAKTHQGEIHRFRMTRSQMHEYLAGIEALRVDEVILDFPAYQPKYLDWLVGFHEEFGSGKR
jgi:hypothetical protein